MRFVLPALCMLLAASPAFAGAWTQPQGDAQFILSVYYNQTSHYTDTNGHTQRQPTYSKDEINPYFEYGLADGLTAGANLLLDHAHQDAGNGAKSETNYNLGDSEFFLRKRLWQQGGFVLSAEPMIKLPSPESSKALPQLGGRSIDAGMGLSAGYGFSALGLNHFVDVDTQYRHRFGTPKDQVRVNATLGIGVTDNFTIMPQVFTTWRTASPKSAAFTESSSDDYNLVKLQLSGVYKLREDLSLQAGFFDNAAGRNIGGGGGVFIAVWKRF